MSNFAFLQAEWGMVFEAAHRAESAVHSDDLVSCFYAGGRGACGERLFKGDGEFQLLYEYTMSALIHEQSLRQA